MFLDIGLILIATIICQWIAWRFKLPVIVLLTSVGLILGPGLDILQPDKVFGDLLTPLIELVVALILFEGGLSLKIHEFKKVSHGLIRLFTVSIILQIAFIALLGVYLINFNILVSIVLGSLLIVTGPTVIIPALREARLKSNVSHYLKWEGIINDPIGAMLAIVMLQVITFYDANISILFFNILKGNFIAFAFAISFFMGIKWLVNRALIPQFLKISFFLCLILIQFIFANKLQQGSGLLAVTIFGVLIGNSGFDLVKELREFKESLTTFSVSLIFIILASTLKVESWEAFKMEHILFVILISFVVRPFSLIISTFKSGMTFKEQMMIGIYGPKGIVAASVAGIIGIELKMAGYVEGELFLPIVFSVIILTVVIHSIYLKPFAKLLDLHHEKSNGLLIVGANPVSIQLAEKLNDLKIPVLISDSTWSRLSYARQAGVPVHYGEILTDRNFDEPNLTQFNYLLAMTDDNSYNVLLCHVLSHEFGTDHVYSLPSEEDFFSEQGEEEGKLLKFKEKPLYYNLMKLFHQGSLFRTTELSTEYKYNDFLDDHMSDTLLPLLIIRENQRIEFYSGYKSLKPVPGDKIVYYNKAEEASGGDETSSDNDLNL